MQPRAKGAVFWLMPARVKLKAIGGMLKGRGPKAVVQPAVANPEEMGYSGLYAAILSYGKSRVAIALRILMVEENFPVVIHCTHGKDRTGVIIMLLLLLCNVSTELQQAIPLTVNIVGFWFPQALQERNKAHVLQHA
ncbi:hypothetical protein MMC34_008654, partial [Xylographa carneopallida]|nr:hypothetical protein [Xylographa carneopallida]